MSIAELKPSRFRLPHQCSPDRRRARAATLRSLRDLYGLVDEQPVDHGGAAYALPPRIQEIPSEEEFSVVKRAWIASHKAVAAANAFAAMALNPMASMASPRDYARLLVGIPGPPLVMSRWREDDEFARQRLCGANPHELRRWKPHDDDLIEAAEAVLLHRRAPRVGELEAQGRLFVSDYTEMAHTLVQQHVPEGLQLSSPLGVFYADGRGVLHALAIRLTRGGEIVTPLSPEPRWLWARSHLQAADGVIHEAVRHLLDTHLVTEVFAVVTARQLHPDHPVRQLLSQHLRFTVAIDCLARRDLLSPGGPIDLCVAPGVAGAMNLARIYWKAWSFRNGDPRASLKERGVDDPNVLTEFFYRDDALAHHALLERYVGDIVEVWYADDGDVAGDEELAAWAGELVTLGKINGFPAAIGTRTELRDVLVQIIFRATVGHAAVNNGQFDKYSWVPNSPGSMRALPARADGDLTEDALWKLFPTRKRSLAQLSMAWILSTPTDRSIVAAGDVEAFDPAIAPPAARAVGVFRRELKALAQKIKLRNETLLAQKKVPYTWLDPYNVSCSVDT